MMFAFHHLRYAMDGKIVLMAETKLLSFVEIPVRLDLINDIHSNS